LPCKATAAKATKENTTFAASEQNLTIAQMLESTTPIEAPKHRFKNLDEARKWAKENITGTYNNKNTGEDISVSKTAIGKYLSEKAVSKSVNKEQTHPVKITVKVTKNEGSKAYSYEVMEIENPTKWQGFHNDLLGLSDRNTLTFDGNTNTIADPLMEHAHPSKKSFRSDERNQTTNIFASKDTNISEVAKKY
jgi:hypothetical protein